MKRLALGTVQFGMDYGINNSYGKPPLSEVYSILDTAYENNIELLDTAPAYGESEKIIGNYMKKTRKRFRIATKLLLHGKSDYRNEVNKSINTSLSNLHVQEIDYLFMHRFENILDNQDLLMSISEYKEAGIIRNVGVSIYDIEEADYIIQNLSGKVDAIQLPMNLFDLRWIRSGVLSRAKDKGFELFARSIYLQGLIFMDEKSSTKVHRNAGQHIAKLNTFSREKGLEIAEIAVNFIDSIKEIDFMVVGCERTSQLQSTLRHLKSADDTVKREISEFVMSSFSNVEAEIIDPRVWLK